MERLDTSGVQTFARRNLRHFCVFRPFSRTEMSLKSLNGAIRDTLKVHQNRARKDLMQNNQPSTTRSGPLLKSMLIHDKKSAY